MPYEVKSRCETCQEGDDLLIGLWPEHLGVFICGACRKRTASIGENGFGRSDRRAQGGSPTLRSIRPKRAVSLDLARTIASSAAMGIAQGGRVKYAPGIGPTRVRRHGSAASSA
jgi:hypothetical protein